MGEEAEVFKDLLRFAGDILWVDLLIPAEGKPFGVGTEPVSEDGEAGKEVDSVFVELGGGFGWERTEFGDEEVKEFLAKGKKGAVSAFA